MSSQPLPVVSNDVLPIVPKKPPVDPSALAHKDLRRGPFWQKIPAYKAVDEKTFLDHAWQAKNSITKVSKLVETIQELVPAGFVEDLEGGMKRAPMSVRVSPYLVSLIDWEHPYEDPERTQFFPVASRLLADHPKLGLDSLHEQADAPVPGLTHRYQDKALFLPLDTCPVYCRFCTRSYAIGLDTDEVEKVHLRPNDERWKRAYQYIASRPELEDIVISGGDAYQLRAQHIEEIGEALLAIPNVRRMRFATKGPAVMPMKILTDDPWLDALTRVVEKGRKLHKDVVLHTHFNNAGEITGITEAAMGRLFERGIVVRNQSVLIRGVNDSVEAMTLLVKRLGPRERAPLLRLRARHGERRGRPADERRHGDPHREERARQHGRLQHADVRRRRAGRRRQARRALVRVLRPRHRRQRVRRAEREAGAAFPLLRPAPPAVHSPAAPLDRRARAAGDGRGCAEQGAGASALERIP